MVWAQTMSPSNHKHRINFVLNRNRASPTLAHLERIACVINGIDAIHVSKNRFVEKPITKNYCQMNCR